MDNPDFKDLPKHIKIPEFSSSPVLTTYTTIRVINEIKRTCGIEAMLEYCEKYCRNVERDSPRLQTCVDVCFAKMDIPAIYKQVINSERE